jgi:hypothetical protein
VENCDANGREKMVSESSWAHKNQAAATGSEADDCNVVACGEITAGEADDFR